jgi:hypothetical protein
MASQTSSQDLARKFPLLIGAIRGPKLKQDARRCVTSFPGYGQ